MRILKFFGGDFGETAPDLGLPWFPPSPPTRLIDTGRAGFRRVVHDPTVSL